MEETRKELREKGYNDEEIDLILSGALKNNDPDPADPADDPPDPEVKVGVRLRTAEELKKDFDTGVKATGKRFLDRIKTPKVDPIAAGSSDLAEGKYAGKMKEVLDEKRRQTKLKTLTMEDDWSPEVAKLREEDWVGPTTRKTDKWGDRWNDLYDARIAAAKALDKMPVATSEDRKRKMSANLDVMRLLGRLSKGVIDRKKFDSELAELTKLT